MRAIQHVAPGIFRLRKYYGDGRRNVSIAGERTIDGTMDRRNEIFNGVENNASTIVICSYQTWNERHGPKGFRKWLKKRNPMWTKTELNGLDTTLDPDWPANLSRCFEIAILDEAHELKSLRAKATYAVSWLDADFHVMVTATPIPNGIYDFQGYMGFIENRHTETWWSQEELQPHGLTDQVNPFDDLEDLHPAARLRLTFTAAKDYIFNNNIPAAVQGRRLAAIWRVVLIRRTNSSRIPFTTGPSIGESLPRVKSVLLNCSHSQLEQGIYTAEHEKYTNVLIEKGSDKKRPKWSLNTHRSLTMLCTALQLPSIDLIHNLKADQTKKILQKYNFFMDWFNNPPYTLHEDTPTLPEIVSRNDPGPLLLYLCFGAPKIRALLRNISTQVSRESLRKPSTTYL